MSPVDFGACNYYTTLPEKAVQAPSSHRVRRDDHQAAASPFQHGGSCFEIASGIDEFDVLMAPFMAPSRAVCIGTIYRMPQVAGRGLVKQIGGLLLMGSGIAYALTMLLQNVIGGYEITPEIALRAIPASKTSP